VTKEEKGRTYGDLRVPQNCYLIPSWGVICGERKKNEWEEGGEGRFGENDAMNVQIERKVRMSTDSREAQGKKKKKLRTSKKDFRGKLRKMRR